MAQEFAVLTLPGLGGSDQHHWQSMWEREGANFFRVEQGDWNRPDLDSWMKNLSSKVSEFDCPVFLVAHGLSCSLVAHWAMRNSSAKIAGALLVAPADIDDETRVPEIAASFSPMPLNPIWFPTIVAYSKDDPYVPPERARFFAEKWGASLHDIGEQGHMNSGSTLGAWREGKEILLSLVERELNNLTFL